MDYALNTMNFYQYMKRKIVVIIFLLLRYRWVKVMLIGGRANNKLLSEYYARAMLSYALLKLQDAHIAEGIKALDLLDLDKVDAGRLRIIAMFYDVCGKSERWAVCVDLIDRAEKQVLSLSEVDKLGCRIFGRTYAPIGHSGLIEIYVKAKILNLVETSRLIICLEREKFANYALIQYWSQHYCQLITESHTVDRVTTLLAPCEEKLESVKMADGRQLPFEQFALEVQLEWERLHRQPLLTLMPQHKEQGYKYLQALGLPKDAWFCGLHVRDTKDALSDVRNASLDTYDLAISEIERLGGWVVRIGDNRMPPLNSNKHRNVIDYAHRPDRADWLDVFIIAASKFFIGTGSGPSAIAISFNVPVLYTNWGPLLSRHWGKQDILVPKQYWNMRTQRYLNMYERMGPSVGRAQSKAALLCQDIEVHDNTPEILKAAVVEMMCQTKNNYVESKAQTAFRELCILNNVYPTRIAKAFIDNHPQFFENLKVE